MPPPLRQTRSYLMDLFQRHGFHPRHDLGQNFLIDLNLLEYILAAAEVGPEDVVLEVGPGTGGLTTFLAHKAGAVVAVELDPNMFRFVSEATAGQTNVTLLQGDALHNKNRLSEELLSAVQARLSEAPGRRLKLVANLPYAAATPVVSNLVATELPWSRMVITVQFELALRMCAPPGSSHYGALAVWLQSQAQVRLLKKLGPTVFWPRPKVDSAIVQIDPDPQRRAEIANRAFLQEFIRRLFQQRRKVLRTVLIAMDHEQWGRERIDLLLNDLGLESSARAEDLPVRTLVELANRIGVAGASDGPSDDMD